MMGNWRGRSVRVHHALVALAALAVALFAWWGVFTSAHEIRVELANFQFTPALVKVKAGERVRFVLANRSDTLHEFESEDAGIDEVEVAAGKSQTVVWTAPSTPGLYRFECDLHGHDGMSLWVKVVR